MPDTSLSGLARSYQPAIPANWPTPKPNTIAEALDDLAAGALPSSSAATLFIFRPGGVAAGNVYTDFAALSAAVLAASLLGSPRTVYFDFHLQPSMQFALPAGAFDQGPSIGLTWKSALPNNIFFANGTTIVHPPFNIDNVSIQVTQAGAPFVYAAANQGLFLQYVQVACVAGPLTHVLGAPASLLVPGTPAVINGAVPFFETDAGGSTIFSVGDGSSIGPNANSGPGAFSIDLFGSAVQVDPSNLPNVTLASKGTQVLAPPSSQTLGGAIPGGVTIKLDAPPFTLVGKGTNVKITASLQIVSTGLPSSDDIAFTILRDGAPIGPTIEDSTDIVRGFTKVTGLTWVDTVAPLSTHTWSIGATNLNGDVMSSLAGHSSILVEQQLS
jgi:hypothetical protein